MEKRLYKSSTDKKLDGVCAGIAEYCNIDPTLVRLGYAAVTIFSALIPGIVAYIVASMIIPRKPE